jgi:hypothetical protein
MLRVPIIHPAWSGNISVLVEGFAESILSADLQARDLGWFGDRLGQRAEWERPAAGPGGRRFGA